jgi:CheY-like chemotaxis protein
MADTRKKILLVDDDEFHLSVAETMLKGEYEIFTAKSGQDALESFRKGLVPNLVLLDILMPNMDGWETYNRIRAISLLQNTPIAFLTSINGPIEEKRAIDAGAADYIMKPYSKEDILARIKIILKNYELKAAKPAL